MSASSELQKLIRDTLKASESVMGLVNEVYDSVPANPWGSKGAYLSFGPTDVVEDDAECIIGGSHTVQIDCWTRSVGSVHCKQIVDAVKAALHEQDLELTNYGLVQMRVTMRRVFRDPDGLTTHGVVTVEADIEEPI